MSKWFAQIFKRDMQAPYFEGEFLDFQVLKEKIATELRYFGGACPHHRA